MSKVGCGKGMLDVVSGTNFERDDVEAYDTYGLYPEYVDCDSDLWSGIFGDIRRDVRRAPVRLRYALPGGPEQSLSLKSFLRLQYPSWDTSGLAEVSSAKDITAFLSTPKQCLIDPITGQIIPSRPHQVNKIDPERYL